MEQKKDIERILLDRIYILERDLQTMNDNHSLYYKYE